MQAAFRKGAVRMVPEDPFAEQELRTTARAAIINILIFMIQLKVTIKDPLF